MHPSQPQAVNSSPRWLRATGAISAASSLLLPKCPLCWMALTGSLATAGALQRSVSTIAAVILAFAVFKFAAHRRYLVRWAAAIVAFAIFNLARLCGIPYVPALLAIVLLAAGIAIYRVVASRCANHACVH